MRSTAGRIVSSTPLAGVQVLVFRKGRDSLETQLRTTPRFPVRRTLDLWSSKIPLFKSFLRGSYEGSINAHKLKVVDSESILKFTERVVQHAAKTGNSVIVGRGSQQFLRNRQDTLRVFLYAPREEKVRRLVARGKSEKEAEELVDTVDRERIDFIQKYFHVEWPDRAIYHTMINTTIGDDAVIHMIPEVMKTFDARVTA